MSNNSGGVSLAADVLFETLSRLPVKSLLRFKCICKEWRSIIRSPDFISKHFNRETNWSRLIVHYCPPNRKISRFLLLPAYKNLEDAAPVNEDLSIKMLVAPRDVLGPVNGLFFLFIPSENGIDDRLALWNLATRELRNLSTPEPPFSLFYTPSSHSFGFGIDCLSNDYKVVWFRTYRRKEMIIDLPDPYPVVIGTIYTLSTNSWRYFTFPFGLSRMPQNSMCNTYIGGVYYWLSEFDRVGDFSIISFDMGTEVFRDIQVPKILEKVSPSLGLCNDLLALFACDYDVFTYKGSSHVWVMKEEGYWNKLLSFGPYPGFSNHCMFWNNNILFDNYDAGRLLLCNTDSCETKDLGIQGQPGDALFHTFSYKESLVSVKVGNEDNRMIENVYFLQE